MSGQFSLAVEELLETSPRAEQPSGARVELKPHQLALVHRCRQYETGAVHLLEFRHMREVSAYHGFTEDCTFTTQVGVIADGTGAGKSYVILALAADPGPVKNDRSIRSYGNNRVVLTLYKNCPLLNATVLVVPHNLCNQWRQYVEAFGAGLRTCFVARTVDLVALRNRHDRGDADINDLDLIVVTATFYSQLATFIRGLGMRVKRLVFDEVDSLNIPNSANIEAQFTWFVTASYGNLLYPRGEHRLDWNTNHLVCHAAGLRHRGFIYTLFCELNSADRKYVRLIVVKNSDAFVQQSMAVPPLEPHYVRCRTPQAIRVLNGLAASEVIERLNANDIRSAVALLAPSSRVACDDDIVNVVIENYAKQVRNLLLRIEYAQRAEYSAEAERTAELDRLTAKQKQLENTIEAIRERVRARGMCSICYEEDVEPRTVVRCCQNAFCLRCISKWIATRPSCPVCNAGLGMCDLLVVDRTGAAQQQQQQKEHNTGQLPQEGARDLPNERNDKVENLRCIIRSCLKPDARVLVFSGYDHSFEPLTAMLGSMGVRYGLLKGNAPQIEATLRRFKDGELRVLLVNPHNYGNGLNLQFTTDVVMFHRLDDEISRQVIGRAQRCGREGSLRVWYLLYENELQHAPNAALS